MPLFSISDLDTATAVDNKPGLGGGSNGRYWCRRAPCDLTTMPTTTARCSMGATVYRL